MVSPLKRKINYDNVLWATYSDPEPAHLGYTEEEPSKILDGKIKIHKHHYSDLDRAQTDNTLNGLAKIITDFKGRIIGAHILGKNAGDIIHEAQIIRSLKKPLQSLQPVIHAYPTYADILRKAGKSAKIEGLKNNPFVKIFLEGTKRS